MRWDELGKLNHDSLRRVINVIKAHDLVIKGKASHDGDLGKTFTLKIPKSIWRD